MKMDKLSSTRPLLMRVSEASAQIGVGKTKFYELVNGGFIEVVKIGSATRVKAESLDRFVAGLPAVNQSRRQS
jgi:excisionase family DNA binding protein